MIHWVEYQSYCGRYCTRGVEDMEMMLDWLQENYNTGSNKTYHFPHDHNYNAGIKSTHRPRQGGGGGGGGGKFEVWTKEGGRKLM